MIENLVKARSNIIFIIGLIASLYLIDYLETRSQIKITGYELETTFDSEILREHAPLTPTEMAWANAAWKYFENNTIESTGMVNSVDQYQASTLWDTSSYIMGLISAYRLSIIGEVEYKERLHKVLNSIEKLELYDDHLPNKSYNTISLDMVDYTNTRSEEGIGWSAIDIGRVLTPFLYILWNHEEYRDVIQRIIRKWHFDKLAIDGTMFGARRVDGVTEYVQEGRLGYEEYASKSFQLIGIDVSNAIDYLDYLSMQNIEGVEVATDSRTPELFQAHNYVVSEPYILDGIEYGWDVKSKELAYRVFLAQKNRYESTGVLTAVSEDNINQPPYFVYNTVFTGGKSWNAITEDGEDASRFKTLSSKAAVGWYVLYDDEYTDLLFEQADTLYNPQKGWYSGRYEIDGEVNDAITANTNGIILEALAYKVDGPIVLSSYKKETQNDSTN